MCAKKSLILRDKGVSFAIQKGLQISRSTIRWYEHNSISDLERVLQETMSENAGRALTRRFIVTEGLFENTGDIVDLQKIVCITYTTI